MTRVLAACCVALMCVVAVAAQSRPQRLGIGEVATPAAIAAVDSDVRPDGVGLPPGQGTAREGGEIYARACATCHGARGEGGVAEALVGSEPRGMAPFGPLYEQWRGGRPDVPFTVGNYWPYATTLFDYVRRAMPPTAPGMLSADETYAVVAWILSQNGIIPDTAVMTAVTVPTVIMPAHERFVPDNRRGRPEVR